MNYEKQTFVNGQVLTAECLNRMEEGIKGACDAAPPSCTSKDCSKVLSYGENGPEWVDMPSGGGGSSVELDTTLTQEGKAADAKAVGDRIDGITSKYPGTNLFNYDEWVEGENVQLNGTVTKNASFGHTGFIPVTPGYTVVTGTKSATSGSSTPTVAYYMAYVTAYDENKTAVSSAGLSYKRSYTVPEGIAYVRISIDLSSNTLRPHSQINCTPDGSFLPYEEYGEVERPYKFEETQEKIAELQEAVQELDDKIENGGGSGGSVEVDATLTQEGKAADAKAVGDKVANLSEDKIDRSEFYFNVWDEQWDTGAVNGVYNLIRSKNYVPVKPETEYYIKLNSTVAGYGVTLAFYDSNQTKIGETTSYKLTFTTPAGCKYLKFGISRAAYGAEYKHDICINVSQPDNAIEPHNGQYVPYGNSVERLQKNVTDLSNFVDEIRDSDIGVGDRTTLGNSDGLSVVDKPNNIYVDSYKVGRLSNRRGNTRRIMAVNHDDLQSTDYVAVRKLYNKYGFNANFSFILKPFIDATELELATTNIKQLIADGHSIGLHAIFNESAWWLNKTFDIRPDGTFTFAPTLSEQRTVVSDGKNVFGKTVTSSSTLANIGFANPPSSLATVPVTTMTENQYADAIKHYCLRHMTSTTTGLDLDGNTQTWAMLRWLEYWYNELIDNTLGYSNASGVLLDDYIADYEVPIGTEQTVEGYSSYYPDAEHLKNGKIVFFDDTENAHYSDTEYQKVGRFKQGLFKGSASAMNFEVTDRCIDIAKAFLRHYINYDNFTSFNTHGMRYVLTPWQSADYFPYDNRDLTILSGETGRMWHSRCHTFTTQNDILLNKGIKMMMHVAPIATIIEGQDGLYFGQQDIRYPYFHRVQSLSGRICYIAFFGTNPSDPVESMNYATYKSYIEGQDDLLKFAYEKAGQTFTKPDGTGSMYMFPYIKNCIDSIRACVGTGKIPCLSLDTIAYSASMMAATEILFRYCYENDITIVPVEEARRIAASHPREYRSNYMPNPQFTQSLLNSFGGSSTAKDAYIPDGWMNGFGSNNDGNYVVTTETVGESSGRVFTVTSAPDKRVNLYSRIFGLQPGTYKFSCMLKGNGKLNAYVKKNSDYIDNSAYSVTADCTASASGSWEEKTFTITIPEPYQKLVDTTDAASQYCHGYEDNVSNVAIELVVSGSQTVSICRPKLTLVNN